MTKADMAARLAKKTGISQKDAGACLTALFDGDNGIIAKELAAGSKVQFSGFGTFAVRTRAARTGKNPHTGEPMDLPEKDYPAWKAGKTLKDRIAG